MSEKLREIVEKMTPGPWKWAYWANGGGVPIGGFYIPGLTRPDLIVADKSHGAVEMIADDAHGLVTLRNVAPELLAVIEAARRDYHARLIQVSEGKFETQSYEHEKVGQALAALDRRLGEG